MTLAELYKLSVENKLKDIVNEMLNELDAGEDVIIKAIMNFANDFNECEYVFNELISLYGKHGAFKMVNGVTFGEEVNLIVKGYLKLLLSVSISKMFNYSKKRIVNISQKLVNNVNNVAELRNILNDKKQLKRMVNRIANATKKNF